MVYILLLYGGCPIISLIHIFLANNPFLKVTYLGSTDAKEIII